MTASTLSVSGERARAVPRRGSALSEHTRALKVAYIMSRFPKLTETFILYEILALEGLGARVEVYPLLRERQPVTHPEAEQLVQRAHFHPFISLAILRAQWHFIRRDPINYCRLWFDVLRGTWGSLNFLIGAIGIFPKAVRFAYEMAAQGISHVHAHFASHPAVAALIIHRLTGIPFSFTAHGSDLHVERRMLDIKIAAAAFVVAISAYNKEFMVKECGEGVRKKIHVIHCGVDPEVFLPPRERHGRGPFQIVCVASFEEVKGHTYLIDAIQLLRERGTDFVCHLVGDGPLRREVEARVAQPGLREQVRFHGGLTRVEVARLFSEADAAVLASVPTRRGKREGIPVVLMEAMASGLPVVASAVSGIPELVEPGRTGLLVPPGDAAALADALQALEQDRELRFRMGLAGREKVLREFNLRTNTLELLRLFLLDESGEDRTAPSRDRVEAARAL